MPISRRIRPPALLPPLPSVNWGSPLAQGLAMAHLLNVSAAPLDLAVPNIAPTMNGSFTLGSGPAGGALTFDGATTYLNHFDPFDALDFLNATGVFTIAARFRLNNYNADAAGVILGGEGSSSAVGTTLFYENRSAVGSPRAFRLFVGVGVGGSPSINAQTASGVIGDNAWHTVVAVGNVPHGTFYVDGLPVANAIDSGSGGTASPVTNGPKVGVLADLSGLYFAGQIEHVLVWNRAFSASEAAAYHMDTQMGFPGLFRWTAPAALPTFLDPVIPLGCMISMP